MAALVPVPVRAPIFTTTRPEVPAILQAHATAVARRTEDVAVDSDLPLSAKPSAKNTLSLEKIPEAMIDMVDGTIAHPYTRGVTRLATKNGRGTSEIFITNLPDGKTVFTYMDPTAHAGPWLPHEYADSCNGILNLMYPQGLVNKSGKTQSTIYVWVTIDNGRTYVLWRDIVRFFSIKKGIPFEPTARTNVRRARRA